MKLNPNAFGLALGLVTAVLSLLCAFLIASVPVPTMNAFGWMAHMNNLANIIGPRSVTLPGTITGIVVFSVIAYVLGWLFAVLYNKFARNSK